MLTFDHITSGLLCIDLRQLLDQHVLCLVRNILTSFTHFVRGFSLSLWIMDSAQVQLLKNTNLRVLGF